MTQVKPFEIVKRLPKGPGPKAFISACCCHKVGVRADPVGQAVPACGGSSGAACSEPWGERGGCAWVGGEAPGRAAEGAQDGDAPESCSLLFGKSPAAGKCWSAFLVVAPWASCHIPLSTGHTSGARLVTSSVKHTLTGVRTPHQPSSQWYLLHATVRSALGCSGEQVSWGGR